MLGRFTFLGFVLSLGIFALATTARVHEDQTHASALVNIEHARAPGRTVLLFIDSLSHTVATNPEIMPTLSRLAQRGVSFDVEPCRDQLTYLCLRAAFTGHDDSSLLAISDNFRPNQEGPPDSLLSATQAKGMQTRVVGSHDLHPYRRWITSEQPIDKEDERPERLGNELRHALRSNPELVIVALSSGDMAAHAHGTRSTEYVASFRRIDTIVAAVVAILGPECNLIVFGDHGHDTAGRHLPGTEAKTWAVYAGPAFRAGVRSTMAITDHRAVLGTLLGVPTEPIYRGPPLSTVFDADWVTRTLPRGLPNLAASRDASHGPSSSRWLTASLIAAITLLGAWAFAQAPLRRRSLGLAALAVSIASGIGLGYDWIRNVVHDHGDSPERALCLLFPVALGVVVSAVAQRGTSIVTPSAQRLLPAAAATLLASFLLMLPTSYYYGSRRAVILAAVVGLCSVMASGLLQRTSTWSRRPETWLVFSAASCILVSYYSVRQLGPETGGASTWALDARLYTQYAWLALVVAKLVLYAVLIRPRTASYPLDCTVGAWLLATSALVEIAGIRLPRELYLLVFVALVLGAGLARHQLGASLFAGALLLLDHLYSGHSAQLAPIEVLLAGTAAWVAWQRVHAPQQQSWLAGLSITVAVYLMLWPTVGFHLAGLDFSFMFEWIAAANYEKAWQWIAVGLVLKLGLPIGLVIVIGREQLRDATTQSVVVVTLSAKVALLAVLTAFFATSHSMASQQATAILSELVLVLFGACTVLLALPAPRRERETRHVQAWDASTVKSDGAVAA
jgi:hypothetical protein